MLFDAKEIRAWEMEMARLTQAQHDRWAACFVSRAPFVEHHLRSS